MYVRFLKYLQARLVSPLHKSTKIEMWNDMYFQQIKVSVNLTEYRDSLWNKSSVWLDYIEDWNRLNQFEIFEEQENNVVLNENSVDRKPCINRESKSDELTI